MSNRLDVPHPVAPVPASEQPQPIPWAQSVDEAQEKAAARSRPVMLVFSGAPGCAASEALESVTFAGEGVAEAVDVSVVPLRLQADDEPELVARYRVTMTPTIVLTDANGNACYRIEGFLPAEEFLTLLSLGVGTFECRLQEPPPPDAHVDASAPTELGGTDQIAQALYWQATARFRRTGDTARLRSDWQAIASQFPRSPWAQRMRLVDEARDAS